MNLTRSERDFFFLVQLFNPVWLMCLPSYWLVMFKLNIKFDWSIIARHTSHRLLSARLSSSHIVNHLWISASELFSEPHTRNSGPCTHSGGWSHYHRHPTFLARNRHHEPAQLGAFALEKPPKNECLAHHIGDCIWFMNLTYFVFFFKLIWINHLNFYP